MHVPISQACSLRDVVSCTFLDIAVATFSLSFLSPGSSTELPLLTRDYSYDYCSEYVQHVFIVMLLD